MECMDLMSGNARVAMFLTFYYMCGLLWFPQRLFPVCAPAVISSPELKANSIPVTPASVRHPSVHNFKHLLL